VRGHSDCAHKAETARSRQERQGQRLAATRAPYDGCRSARVWLAAHPGDVPRGFSTAGMTPNEVILEMEQESYARARETQEDRQTHGSASFEAERDSWYVTRRGFIGLYALSVGQRSWSLSHSEARAAASMRSAASSAPDVRRCVLRPKTWRSSHRGVSGRIDGRCFAAQIDQALRLGIGSVSQSGLSWGGGHDERP
jgi:hypothetical protein